MTNTWKALSRDMRKDFHGMCISVSCNGWDDFTYTNIGMQRLPLAGGTPTEVKIQANVKTIDNKTAAQLLLSKFASYFSTDNASGFDFGGFVDNNFEELQVGHHVQATLDFIPLRLARVETREWILTIGKE